MCCTASRWVEEERADAKLLLFCPNTKRRLKTTLFRVHVNSKAGISNQIGFNQIQWLVSHLSYQEEGLGPAWRERTLHSPSNPPPAERHAREREKKKTLLGRIQFWLTASKSVTLNGWKWRQETWHARWHVINTYIQDIFIRSSWRTERTNRYYIGRGGALEKAWTVSRNLWFVSGRTFFKIDQSGFFTTSGARWYQHNASYCCFSRLSTLSPAHFHHLLLLRGHWLVRSYSDRLWMIRIESFFFKWICVRLTHCSDTIVMRFNTVDPREYLHTWISGVLSNDPT